MTEQTLLADATAAFSRVQLKLQNFLQTDPAQADFDDTFGAFSCIEQELIRMQAYVYHLDLAGADKPGLMAAYNSLFPRLSQTWNAVHASPAVHQILHRWAQSPQAAHLAPEKKHAITLILSNISPQKNDKTALLLAKKKSQLHKQILKYQDNRTAVSQSWQHLFTTPAQLDGVPAATLSKMEEAARRAGLATEQKPAWLITLTSPGTMLDIMEHCTVAETRKTCWQGLKSPGYISPHDNAPVVHRIMQLRHDIALLEGYANHADHKLRHFMLKNSRNAHSFVDSMLQRLHPLAEANKAALRNGAAAICGNSGTTIHPWDLVYYCTQIDQASNKLNAEALRPYFEYESILQGTMAYFGNLYGLSIRELPTCYRQRDANAPADHIDVWAPGVRVFAVHDAANGTHLGSFYLDAFARRGKKYNAGCQLLASGTNGGNTGKGTPQLLAMMLPLQPAAQGEPLLLSHRELRMLFHEFGHVLHLILGKGEIHHQTAAYQALDFIELPAQLHEAHAWEPEVLCAIARHHSTGEPLPRELAEQLAATRYGLKQRHAAINLLLTAKIDLELHTRYKESFYNKSLDEVIRTLIEPWVLPSTIGNIAFIRNFEHAVDGYDAAYYAYTLAEVMAADVFAALKQQGLTNSAFGKNIRKTLLEPGYSLPPQQLYCNLMGRGPKADAFLKNLLK